MTTTKQFHNQLHDIFTHAEERGDWFVKVNAGDLHRMVGGYPGTNHRMPMCCGVMYDEMKADDKILAAPPKGKGASVTIQYRLPRADSSNLTQST